MGSITKTFVALAVMRLVDAGRIDLERPIKELLEDFVLSDKGAEEKITMKHLLTHTSGTKGDYFKDFGYGKDALEKLVRNMSSLPQINPPGRILSYCNSGFYVAGRVIEAVTGKTFEEAIIEQVSGPLGLENIHFFPEEIITERFTFGQLIAEDRISIARPWAVGRTIHPAGGIVTNIKEALLNYSAFYFSGRASDRNGIISVDSFTKLITGKIGASPASKVALGWSLKRSMDWRQYSTVVAPTVKYHY
ncbi:serine hydrolase domain-containing protein [Mesotoga sp. UBA5557]|uniref:serine hydrolase domain-containing protein n=2 Tax=unclassified Mesotoga TaxID=1184398 RepID=UPI0025ED7465|nr:serine hydrolase domain-containing protein [Mesotoga sp. UBA5557]